MDVQLDRDGVVAHGMPGHGLRVRVLRVDGAQRLLPQAAVLHLLGR